MKSVGQMGGGLTWLNQFLALERFLYSFLKSRLRAVSLFSKIFVDSDRAACRSHRRPRYLRSAGSALSVHQFESSTHSFVSKILEQRRDFSQSPSVLKVKNLE